MSGRNQTGAATASAVVWLGVVMAMAMACVLAVAVITTHRRSQAAADLAALAGAQATQRGEDGCAAAVANARSNRAEVRGCEIHETDVVVTVAAFPPEVFGGALDVPARARAGPASRGGQELANLLP